MALEAKHAARIHLPEEALEDYAFGRLARAELANFEGHLLACEHCQKRLDAEDNFAETMLLLAAMERTATVKTFPASPISPSAPESSSISRALCASLVLTWIPRAWNASLRELQSWNCRVFKRWNAPAWGVGLVAILAVACGIAAWRLPVIWTSAQVTEWTSAQIAKRASTQIADRNSVQMADAVSLKTLRGGSTDGVAEARPNRPLDLSIDFREGASSPAETGPYRLGVFDAAGNQVWTGTAISSVSGKIAARVEKRLAAGVYWVRLYAHSGKLLREFGLRLE
jgi:hypothetical protein